MSLYKEFNEKKKSTLQEKLGKKNVHQVPTIDKVVVNVWIWSLVTRKGLKDFSDIEKNIMRITGQKPKIVKSRKSVSNFKLREDMPIMLMVTLRKELAYDFVERLVNLTLPRLRDFRGLTPKKFDWHGNYSIGFNNLSMFAEIKPDDIITNCGIQISIVTSADNDEDAKHLLETLWVIFIK